MTMLPDYLAYPLIGALIIMAIIVFSVPRP